MKNRVVQISGSSRYSTSSSKPKPKRKVGRAIGAHVSYTCAWWHLVAAVLTPRPTRRWSQTPGPLLARLCGVTFHDKVALHAWHMALSSGAPTVSSCSRWCVRAMPQVDCGHECDKKKSDYRTGGCTFVWCASAALLCS